MKNEKMRMDDGEWRRPGQDRKGASSETSNVQYRTPNIEAGNSRTDGTSGLRGEVRKIAKGARNPNICAVKCARGFALGGPRIRERCCGWLPKAEHNCALAQTEKAAQWERYVRGVVVKCDGAQILVRQWVVDLQRVVKVPQGYAQLIADKERVAKFEEISGGKCSVGNVSRGRRLPLPPGVWAVARCGRLYTSWDLPEWPRGAKVVAVESDFWASPTAAGLQYRIQNEHTVRPLIRRQRYG